MGIEFMPEREGVGCHKAQLIDPWSGRVLAEPSFAITPSFDKNPLKRAIRVLIPSHFGDVILKVDRAGCAPSLTR